MFDCFGFIGVDHAGGKDKKSKYDQIGFHGSLSVWIVPDRDSISGFVPSALFTGIQWVTTSSPAVRSVQVGNILQRE
jgi:hypothetical protein